MQIVGGRYFQASAGAGGGIEIAGGSAGYVIKTKLVMIDEPALVHTSDNGLGWIEALVYLPIGAAITGTPHASSKRDVRVYGGGTGTVDV